VKFSVGSLLISVAVIAISLGALTYGGVTARLASGAIATCTVALMIIAFVGHKRKRMFAIGYFVAAFCYIALHIAVPLLHGNDSDEYLPTNRLLRSAWFKVVDMKLVDKQTGESRPYEPGMIGGAHRGEIVMTSDMPGFLLFSHSLILFICGTFGGWFALRSSETRG